MIEFLFALAQDMILAAIPAVGFAMVFNVPVRALRWCALLGAIGHGSRMILMTSGLNIEWSTFYGFYARGGGCRTWYFKWVALVSGASESVYRGGRYPYVPAYRLIPQ